MHISCFVIPAQTGIQRLSYLKPESLDPGLHRDDEQYF